MDSTAARFAWAILVYIGFYSHWLWTPANSGIAELRRRWLRSDMRKRRLHVHVPCRIGRHSLDGALLLRQTHNSMHGNNTLAQVLPCMTSRGRLAQASPVSRANLSDFALLPSAVRRAFGFGGSNVLIRRAIPLRPAALWYHLVQRP